MWFDSNARLRYYRQKGEFLNAGNQISKRKKYEAERMHAGLQLEGAAEAVGDGALVAVGDPEAADCALHDGTTIQR